MKKIKWNWLDTVIVLVVVLVIAVACFILFRPGASASNATDETELFLTFDTPKDPAGTYDVLQVGDEVFSVKTDKVMGTIEKVEILPYKTAVFNEETKQYDVFENTAYPFCRLTVKITGYKTDDGEVYANGMQLLYDEDWYLETTDLRFSATISDIEGV